MLLSVLSLSLSHFLSWFVSYQAILNITHAARNISITENLTLQLTSLAERGAHSLPKVTNEHHHITHITCVSENKNKTFFLF